MESKGWIPHHFRLLGILGKRSRGVGSWHSTNGNKESGHIWKPWSYLGSEPTRKTTVTCTTYFQYNTLHFIRYHRPLWLGPLTIDHWLSLQRRSTSSIRYSHYQLSFTGDPCVQLTCQSWHMYYQYITNLLYFDNEWIWMNAFKINYISARCCSHFSNHTILTVSLVANSERVGLLPVLHPLWSRRAARGAPSHVNVSPEPVVHRRHTLPRCAPVCYRVV